MPDQLPPPDVTTLLAENARLRQELEESRETLRAIRSGEIDAVIVEAEDHTKVLTLGAAEQSYQLIVSQAAQPTALLTADGHILQSNPLFQDLVHLGPRELEGMAFQTLVAPASMAPLQAFLDAATEGDGEMELMLRGAAGQRVPVSFTVRPLRDNPAGPCLLLTDVTAERARDKIISEEILAQSILDQVADAVVVCDPTGCVRRASQAVERLIGDSPLNRDFDDVLPLRHRIDEADVPLRFAEIVSRSDARVWEVVYPRGGDSRHLILSTGFLFHKDGGIRGAVLTLTDITERKRIEQALEVADRRKNEFLAILAHELRNPLAPISNGIRLLRADTLGGDVREKALGLMERQAHNMVRLVDDLMDVSRITRGKIELKKEKLHLAEVLRVAAETSEPLITQFNHVFTLEPVDDGLWVEGDFTRLTQVFSNLLNNAAKYSEPGRRVTLATRVDGDAVVITVTDTGIGIRADMLDRIFDMFAQADDSLERAQGGLGVGLTLVRNLVEMHGGRVAAESDGPAKGSRFIVTLPLAQAPSGKGTQKTGKTANGADMLRILIVEDNPALAQTTGWLVEALGHDYRVAHNGKDALAEADAFRPDVVMLDIGLPGMNGYDICRAMRQNPALASTLFIAQTGWGQSEHKQMATAAGFHHHMVKPIDYDRLQELLDIRART